jgi:dihydrodipicolinate synthase/N-acetylneuraminate lyase
MKPMKTFDADGLLALANLLDELPPERFDFNTFAGEDWQGDPDLSCGTTACSLGWATTMPKFKDQGLRLQRSKHHWVDDDEHLGAAEVVLVRPDEPTVEGAKAAMEVFGLTLNEAYHLFFPGSAIVDDRGAVLLPWLKDTATAQEAAGHIRRFVAFKAKTTGGQR